MTPEHCHSFVVAMAFWLSRRCYDRNVKKGNSWVKQLLSRVNNKTMSLLSVTKESKKTKKKTITQPLCA